MTQYNVFYIGMYYLVCGFTYVSYHGTYAEISTGGPQNPCASNMYYKR